jgi:hypothetical protein
MVTKHCGCQANVFRPNDFVTDVSMKHVCRSNVFRPNDAEPDWKSEVEGKVESNTKVSNEIIKNVSSGTNPIKHFAAAITQ